MSEQVLKESTVFTDLSLDYDERALIINYELVQLIGDAHGAPLGRRKEPRKKRIRLTALDPAGIPALADSIMQSCALIPSTRHAAVVELLRELHHHIAAGAATASSGGGGGGGRSAGGAGARPAPGGGGGAAAGGGAASRPATSGGRSRTGSAAGATGSASGGAAVAAGSGGAGSGPLGIGDDGDDSGDERGVKLGAVDDYLEMLYEEDDVSKRLTGARKLLALAKQPACIAELVGNEMLLGALARILREDWRKNADFTVLLLQFFFCLSQYSPCHGVLLQHRIGDLSMRIVDLELRRHTARQMDVARLTRLADIQAAAGGVLNSAEEAAFRAADAAKRAEEEAAAEAAARAAADKAKAASGKAERAAAAAAARGGGGGGDDDGGADEEDDGGGAGGGDDDAAGGGGGGGAAPSADAATARRITLKPLPAGRIDAEKERRKVRVLTRKQEGLLFVCLSLLMNIAEDVAIERKMCKRNIVGLLVPLLDRDNVPLLLVATAFLRKLSVFEENKDAMAALGIAEKIVALLPTAPHIPALLAVVQGSAPASGGGSTASQQHIHLHASLLRLAFNLTFDPGMCTSLLAAGILHRVAGMMRVPPFRSTCIKMMYHLSEAYTARVIFAGGVVDDRPARSKAGKRKARGAGADDAAAGDRLDGAALGGGPQLVATLLKLVVNFPQAALPIELAATAINLSMHPTSAEVMMQVLASTAADPAAGPGGGGALKAMVVKVAKSGDHLLMKVVRNLSQYTYALQADECLKAAAAEEEGWKQAHVAAVTAAAKEERRPPTRKRRKRVGGAASGGAGAASGGDGKDDEDDDDADGKAADDSDTKSDDGGGGHADSSDDDAEEDEEAAAIAAAARRVPPMPDEPVEYEYPFEGLWGPSVRDLAAIALRASRDVCSAGGSSGGHGRSAALLVESLGTLANLSPRDMPASMAGGFSSLLADDDFLSMLTRHLMPASTASAAAALTSGGAGGGIDDDIVLETIQLLSAIALDPESAPLIAASDLPTLLASIASEKAADSDIMAQLACCVLRLLHWEETQEAITQHTRLPMRLVECLSVANNEQLVSDVYEAVYIMIEYDKQYAGSHGLWRQLQLRRFQLYNREWSATVAGVGSSVGSGSGPVLRVRPTPTYSTSAGAASGGSSAIRSSMLDGTGEFGGTGKGLRRGSSDLQHEYVYGASRARHGVATGDDDDDEEDGRHNARVLYRERAGSGGGDSDGAGGGSSAGRHAAASSNGRVRAGGVAASSGGGEYVGGTESPSVLMRHLEAFGGSQQRVALDVAALMGAAKAAASGGGAGRASSSVPLGSFGGGGAERGHHTADGGDDDDPGDEEDDDDSGEISAEARALMERYMHGGPSHAYGASATASRGGSHGGTGGRPAGSVAAGAFISGWQTDDGSGEGWS